MRSEEEIRKQLATITRGKPLSVEELKKLFHKPRKPIVRDIRYHDEVAKFWFNWVLSDQKRKHCDTFEVLDEEAHEGEK